MLLSFAAVVEAVTGFVLVLDPALVVTWLIGADVDAGGKVLGRCFGVALVALGLACWPGQSGVERGRSAVLGMLVYNAGIALYLTYLRTVEHTGGVLLWPAVVLHAGIAFALARSGLARYSRA